MEGFNGQPKIENKAYNEAEWEKLKQQRGDAVAQVFHEGEKMGVPSEELDKFAREKIDADIANKKYYSAYCVKKGLKIGNEEELKSFGEQMYKLAIENKCFIDAVSLADKIYGKESEELKRADKLNEEALKEAEKKREQKTIVALSKDATFADLFNAFENITEQEDGGDFNFTELLSEDFGGEITDEILALEDKPEFKTAKVIDFFKERGYSQSDIIASLPIKFKRK